MVLDNQRRNIDPILSIFARVFSSVNPNLLTYLSLLFAFFAGMFFYLSSPDYELENYFLFIAVLFVFLNGFFDAIDGKVAKISKKVSKKGDFLDHAIDRYADVLIVGGLALSSWTTNPSFGLLAIIGMLMTSYMGTQGQAVGYKRNYTGILGRADRLAILMVAPIIQHLFIRTDIIMPFGFSFIDWILIYFAVFGNITAIQRFYVILKWFKSDSK